MDPSERIIRLDVRGKRKRKVSRATTDSISSKPRLRGRPMMTASELRNKRTKTATAVMSLPTKPRSWLERLPVELIEQIFFHSLEFNMARASHFLSRALSKESIFKTLILFAFFADDEQHPVEKKHFVAATYRTLSMEERARLQVAVLESRWGTLNRIRQCLPILKRLAIVQQWHEDRDTELRCRKGLTDQDTASSLPDLDDTGAILAYYSQFSATRFPNPVEQSVVIDAHQSYRSCLGVLILPDRLFNPVSWHVNIDASNNDDSDPLQFLQLLWFGWQNTGKGRLQILTDPIVLFLGLETAVRERNREALVLLLEIQRFPVGIEPDPMADHSCIHIPASVLHLATKQGRDSEWILKLVLKNMVWQNPLPGDDDVLTKWALEQERDGSRFAKRLLEVMEGDLWELYHLYQDLYQL